MSVLPSSSIFNSNYVGPNGDAQVEQLDETLDWTITLPRWKCTRVAKEGHPTAEAQKKWREGTAAEGFNMAEHISNLRIVRKLQKEPHDKNFSSLSYMFNFNPIKIMILNHLEASSNPSPRRSVWCTSHLRRDKIWYSTTLRERA